MTRSEPGAPLDVPQPRIRVAPDYTATSGAEAVDFAASIGLVAEPWQALALDDWLGERDDGRWAAYTITEIISRQNGKGGLAEIRCLSGLHLFGEQYIVWSSHLWDTARKMFKRMVGWYTNCDDLRRRVQRVNQSHGEEGIELLNGAALKFATRSKTGARGLSGDCVIIDEAFAHNDEEADALIPVGSARQCVTEGGPQIIYLSSPPLDQVSANKKALSRSAGLPLFRLRRRALSGRGGRAVYRDWGVEGCLNHLEDIDLDDRKLWRQSNPALLYGRLTEEWIAEVERGAGGMSDVGFARERLAIWPPEPATADDTVFDPAAWADLMDLKSQIGESLALAVDVTPDRDWSSIGVYAPRPDGLGHVELIEHRPGTHWVVARLAELREAHQPVAIGLDLRSPAGSLLTALEKAGICRPEDPDAPQRGDLAIPSTREYAAACGQFVDAFRQRKLRHIDQSQLNAAVAGAKTRTVGDAYGWARRAGSIDISPLVAVSLARWTYETRAHLALEPAGPIVLTGSLMA